MTKRLVGIDIGPHTMRLAVLRLEQGDVRVESIATHPCGTAEELAAGLRDALGGEFHLGDRLATCLPGGAAYVRRLSFPFGDRRKIASALPFELSAQLPVALDDYTTAMQPPIKHDEGAQVVAAAVRTTQLAETLLPFDAAGIPLQILDLAPHAYVAGLRNFLPDGLLACAMDQGTGLVLVRSGEVVDHRHLPLAAGTPVAGRARAILREATALWRTERDDDMRLQLIGPLADDELAAALAEAGVNAELLRIELDGQGIDAPYLPAVALALRADDSSKNASFNLRQGAFVLKGEWAGLRKTLLVAACLAGLTVAVLAVSMGLRYYDRLQQADRLQQQMASIYRQTMPDAAPARDVPLQMQGAIISLKEELGVVDRDRPTSLALLQTITDLPEATDLDVDEFALEGNEVRIAGGTTSFEAVNRIAERLRKSPHSGTVEVAESKMDLKGSRVNFRMRMTLRGGETP